MSRRVGDLKQAMEWSGQTVIRHVCGTLLDAGLEWVGVVLGYERERLAEELAGLEVHVVENPEYAAGMFSSVQRGLRAAPAGAVACVVALVDQPRVTAGTIRALVEDHRRAGAAVTIPRFEGRTGHPVVLSREVIEATLSAAPDVRLRDVLEGFGDRTHFLDLETDSVIDDIDTMEDYVRQRRRADG
jgi:molybdenum cofactor cytidylyltransferase